MEAEHEDEHLDALRERLYARGGVNQGKKSPLFTPSIEDIPLQVAHVAPIHSPRVIPPPPLPPLMTTKRRKKTRMTLLVGALIFAVLAAVLSIVFFFFGNTSISGANIGVDVRGSFSVGGGDEYPFTISVTNQNAVPIESASLIIEYPEGTQSATEKGKELYRERKTIDRIDPGEVLNIPAKAIIFGKENDEKVIQVSIDYRIQGSNSTFNKVAPTLRFKVSSSPVVVTVDAVKQITSGQEVTLKVMLSSNSPTPLTGLLLKAEYPDGFDFSSAEPKPSSNENSWVVGELKPEEQKIITIKGLMIGKTTETRIFTFSTGVANDEDRYALASVFTTKTHEISLEKAFIDLKMSVNGNSGDNVVVGAGQVVPFAISFTNTLSDTIYDATIEAVLSGNALDKTKVSAEGGFYDSTKSTIVWDSDSNTNLGEIIPGATKEVRFKITPSIAEALSRTPQVSVSVNVRGKRVREDAVPEELTGTITRTVKVESTTSLTSSALYSIGPFLNTGAVPPIAEKVTFYTLVFAIENGSNSVTDAFVEAKLPLYVTWLDQKGASAGTVSYNASTRVVSWKIGNLDAGKTESAAIQVSFLPSVSQVGTIPALATDQRFRATDRFTGTVLRATAPDLSTQLSMDPDTTKQDGRVQRAQ